MRLVYTSDTNNNIGRWCDIIGYPTDKPRSWTIQYALKSAETFANVITHYSVKNVIDGTIRVVPLDYMTSLY